MLTTQPFGYDDLYLMSTALCEASDDCLRRSQTARAAGDIYKAAYEARRSQKYKKVLNLVENAMAVCNRSTARTAMPAIPIAPRILDVVRGAESRERHVASAVAAADAPAETSR
jgi:hypothetical protein